MSSSPSSLPSSPPPIIVFLDKTAVKQPLPALPPSIPHTFITYDSTPTPSLTISRLQGATVAITNRAPITASTLDACPTLRLIAVAATGYDQVDVPACLARGVAVCNVRGWAAVSVAEHVFALTLALRRQIVEYRDALAQGAWHRAGSHTLLLNGGALPVALAGGVLGIVGYGALGKRVEGIARGFGMEVVVAERRGGGSVRDGRMAFEEVVRQSDVLVLLCPMNEETKGLIGKEELASMKRDALLINCARGGVVDEDALAQALDDGLIAGAGVDVLREEPPREDNPLMIKSRANLLVTPHVGWASRKSLEILVQQLLDNIRAFLEGRPQNLVES